MDGSYGVLSFRHKARWASIYDDPAIAAFSAHTQVADGLAPLAPKVVQHEIMRKGKIGENDSSPHAATMTREKMESFRFKSEMNGFSTTDVHHPSMCSFVMIGPRPHVARSFHSPNCPKCVLLLD